MSVPGSCCKKKPRNNPDLQRGFALLIVLWALVLLALLGSHLVASGHQEVQRVANMREAAAAEGAANGAVYQAVFHLLAGGNAHWAVPGDYRVAISGRIVDVRVTGMAGLINPNTCSQGLMQALLAAIGVDPAHSISLAAAIIDWRTPGEDPRPNGAKLAQYREAGREYGPPNAMFKDLSELVQVLGMTPSISARLLPHLSIYAPEAPDPLLADPIVARAMHQAGERGARFDPSDYGITIAIDATAQGPGDVRFRRHAVVTTANATRGVPFYMLAWNQQGD